MGKNRKEHRKKVKARNQRIKAEQAKNQKALKEYLNGLGLTPEEALVKLQAGEIKVQDEQVFGPKETIIPEPLHTTRLPE